jgi:hypothetical protein
MGMSTNRTMKWPTWALMVAWSAAAAMGAPLWELEVKPDPRAPSGEAAFVHGQVAPEGVKFKLPATAANRICDVAVLSLDTSKPIELIALKEGGELAKRTTDAGGIAYLRFRTGAEMVLRLSGPIGATYQMSVWVGPELPSPVPTMAPMSQVVGPSGAASTPAVPVAAPHASVNRIAIGENFPPAPSPENVFSWMWVLGVTLLVVLILILTALGFISSQLAGHRRASARLAGAKSATAGLALMMVATGISMARADDHATEESIGLGPRGPLSEERRLQLLKPSLLPPGEERKTLSDRITDLHDNVTDRLGKYRSLDGTAGQFLAAAEALRPLLEEFGYLDPAEAAIQPDYAPRGMPDLPSSFLDDPQPSAEKMIRFQEIQDKIEKAKVFLEKNYVVVKQTEIRTGRLTEMANAAAGLSPLAQLAWAKAKANPNEGFNRSAAAMYAKYDQGQASGLDFLKEALIEMSDFEKQNYGRDNWYLYFGLPYYQFMNTRYTRM